MKFLRYRHNWAWGHSEWNCKLLAFRDDDIKSITEEAVENLNDENSWSDKYRGLDYEVVDYPGNDWMKNELDRCKTSIKFMEEKLGIYTALFYKHGGK